MKKRSSKIVWLCALVGMSVAAQAVEVVVDFGTRTELATQGYAGGLVPQSLPSGSNTVHTFVYDVSGAGLGGGAVELDVRVSSLNASNLTSGGAWGIAVEGGANNLWWDVGENLSFELIIRNALSEDITANYTVDLTGASLRWNSLSSATVAGTSISGDGSSTMLYTDNLPVRESTETAFTAERGGASSACQFSQLRFNISSTVAGSGYEEWAFSFPLSGGPSADDDGDGASNLKEFSQGGNPTNAASTGYPVESWVAEAGGTAWLYFKYPHRPGVNSGIDCRLEVSGALGSESWLQAGTQHVETVADGFEPGLDAVIYRVPADQHDQRFARVALDAASPIPASLADLDIFTNGFPHAIYFRYTEGAAASTPYETWATRYGHLDGMLGKMLDEEIYGRMASGLSHYVQYKLDFPNQLVLLHFNGSARDPRFDLEAFAPQLFVHYVGCKSLDAISNAETISVIEVEDTSLFATNIGRDNTGTDNITICALDAEGKPDWTVHEETILLSIDAGNSTITVERGAFGTTPLAFPANQAYLAAHDYGGPWGDNQILWEYNHTLKPPTDSNGKLLWEVLAEDLGNRFLPGGQLEVIDGIEFDVLVDDRGATAADGRKKDFDGDGKADNVDVDGINTYGVGVIQFLARLREIMGPGKLIMADGHSSKKQRGFNLLNGIESERWPDFWDEEIDEWSGGMNRHKFWLENCFPPAFNYVKYDPDVFQPNLHRLGYAAAVLTDTAISSSEKPRDGFDIHEWDELRAGELNQWNWLGRPLGPVQHLARQQPNLLQGVDLSSLITTSAAKVDGPSGLELTGNGDDIEFSLDVPGHLLGEDLTIFIALSADPIAGYPATRNRLFELTDTVGDKVVMSWAGTKPFEAGFYFKDLNAAQLGAEIESSERLMLHSVTAHAHPDICYRIFENGVVIANPSLDPFTFDVSALLPGMNLQHLEAHRNQDDTVNTGLPAGDQIQLPAKDAVFLIRQED